MGIRNLLLFCKESMTEKGIYDYLGHQMVVDAMHQVVKYSIIIRYNNNGNDIYNQNGKSITHIYAILKSLTTFMSLAILPIYVFDGKIPESKKFCSQNRQHKKHLAKLKCDSIEDKLSDEYTKYIKRTHTTGNEEINDIKKLLYYSGIPYIQAPYEADPQCAIMSHLNKIYGVISDDSDMLTYGSSILLKDFSLKSTSIKEYKLSNVLKYLENKKNIILRNFNKVSSKTFEHENLVDISILFGSEYSPRHIRGIDHEDLFKLYIYLDMNLEHTINSIINYTENNNKDQNIYNILKYYHYIDVPNEFIDTWKIAKKSYLDADIISPHTLKYKYVPPDKNKLINLLCVENNCDESDTINFLEHLQILYDLWNNYNNNISEGDSNKDQNRETYLELIKAYQFNYLSLKNNKKYHFIPKDNKLVIS
jgi:5'-3' exonuclease